jgi:ABC-type Mn2+/Zn2+ transport system ATPase subunit
MSPAVTATELTLAYGSRVALADATFVLPEARSIALIGPNGSGKSSLLRALAGLLTPRSGLLEVPAARRRGGVSLVLQTTDVDRSLPLTVGEAVTMARYPHRGVLGRMTRADRAAVDSALERLEVADLRGRQLSELSGGQRQRVLVAQGLAQEADLVLLDEPVTALDAVSHTLIDAAVDAERDAGRTVVTSTHDLADARRADVVLLLAGRVVAAGPPDEVLTEVGLGDAYGGRLVTMGDNLLLLDDPHHHHDHE